MSYSDIELAAASKNLREQAGLDQFTPIGGIDKLVLDLGHELLVEDFKDDFSATCMTNDGIKFAIILNKSQMWNERFKRFTIAHELGHVSLVQHHAEMIRNGGVLKTKSEFQSKKEIEREADLFAINFLSPKPFFLQLISNLEFDKISLRKICGELNISLLAGAFRFVKLSDLCCALIGIDEVTQKIKYDFRSDLMWQINKHENVSGYHIPYQGLVSKALAKSVTHDLEDEEVDISEYYPDYPRRILCKESVFRLGYNNTTIVMLSALDDVDELE